MGRSRLQTVERGISRPSTNKRVCGVFRKYSSVELSLETTDLYRPGQVPSLSVLLFQLFVPVYSSSYQSATAGAHLRPPHNTEVLLSSL